ncbi:MAG: hypothetical protein IID46_11550 [Planctomycetes bacterium]|nr:hypothetical protein [Planctomycetota bacterium]
MDEPEIQLDNPLPGDIVELRYLRTKVDEALVWVSDRHRTWQNEQFLQQLVDAKTVDQTDHREWLIALAEEGIPATPPAVRDVMCFLRHQERTAIQKQLAAVVAALISGFPELLPDTLARYPDSFRKTETSERNEETESVDVEKKEQTVQQASRQENVRQMGHIHFLQMLRQGIQGLKDRVNRAIDAQLNHEEKGAETVEQDADRYVLEKMNEKIIQVEFDGESGVMTGVDAFRIHMLISWGRVHLLQLGGDLALGDEMPSLKAGEAVLEFGAKDGIGIQQVDKKTQKLPELRTIHNRIHELAAEIAETEDVVERQELEQERAGHLRYVQDFLRSDPRQYTKARERVDKGFRAKIKELSKTIPRFAQHLKAARGFDELTDEYTNLPAERISWKFKNFD